MRPAVLWPSWCSRPVRRSRTRRSPASGTSSPSRRVQSGARSRSLSGPLSTKTPATRTSRRAGAHAASGLPSVPMTPSTMVSQLSRICSSAGSAPLTSIVQVDGSGMSGSGARVLPWRRARRVVRASAAGTLRDRGGPWQRSQASTTSTSPARMPSCLQSASTARSTARVPWRRISEMTIPEAASSRSVASSPSIAPTSSTAWIVKRQVPGERSPGTFVRLSPSPPSELPAEAPRDPRAGRSRGPRRPPTGR